MKKIALGLVSLFFSVPVFAAPLIVLPSEDITNIRADILAAAGVIIGFLLLVLGYRLVRRLMGR